MYPDSYLVLAAKQVLRHEVREEMEAAVLLFVEQLLDDKAPPGVLPSFMHALFLANDSPLHPNPGDIFI